MKLLAISLIAFLSINAHAAPSKKHQIKLVEAGKIGKFDSGDLYGSGLAVGRISPFTGLLELVGLTVPDPNSTSTPKRMVKAMVNISSTNPGDPTADQEASDLLDFFFSTKTGKMEDNGMIIPIAKIVTIAYDPMDVAVGSTGCLGLDFEVANQTTPATKECYTVRPKYIIKHNL